MQPRAATALPRPLATWSPALADAMSRPDAAEKHSESKAAATAVTEREDLFTSLYAQLRQIAQRALKRSGPQLTISPTTLLHEAYLAIAHRDSLKFPDHARFMAYASRAMRGLVIDYARERHALKRGGAFEFTCVPTNAAELAVEELDLTRISDALDDLANVEPSLAELVDMKFFCGFSFTEIAAMRGVSDRTVQRDWAKARLYLHDVLREP
jgi:RNA polymerase sigma factor (TIGR02999 family)